MTITIPTPRVPHGPEGVDPDKATADYLREVVKKLEAHDQDGRRRVHIGGSNVTATVRDLLLNTADALEVDATDAARSSAPAIGSIRRVTGPGKSVPTDVTAGAIRIYTTDELHHELDLRVGDVFVEIISGIHAETLLDYYPAASPAHAGRDS